MKKGTFFFFISTVIVGTSLLSGVWGPRHLADSSSGEEYQRLLKTYTRALHAIEENYAEPIQRDRTVYQSIQTMLEKLDPHSVFLDPQKFSHNNEEMRGNYCGIGISYKVIHGRPTVTSPPLPGTPAHRMGIRSGDAILKIRNRPVEGLPLTQIADMFKGPKGSSLNLTLQHLGQTSPVELNIVRDEIPQPSVTCAFRPQPGIGYLRVDIFTETTEQELSERFKQLGSNLNGIILDLRLNHGGYLPAGIALAEAFLEKGQEVVTTKGRLAGSNQQFLAKNRPVQKGTPLVVLIDRESASCSEIVAGAIQDHDRGLILGETSFGKGLVQTVFPLSRGAGLILTTARYFTPSGRLIQRDYKHQSLRDYYRPPVDAPSSAEIKHTDGGREVFGGGGILPDIRVRAEEPPRLTSFQARLIESGAFFDFVCSSSLREHALDRNFEVGESHLRKFREYLRENDLIPDEKEWRESLPFLREQIRNEYVLFHFGREEVVKIAVEKDHLVARALESLPQAKALVEGTHTAINRTRSSQPS
jgi:carboxyl-terminal processing protease